MLENTIVMWFAVAVLASGWPLAGWFAFKAAIRADTLAHERSMAALLGKSAVARANEMYERMEELMAEKRVLADEKKELLSLIVTMKQDGFVGGHGEQFDTPESYSLSDTEEIAEHQRRQAAVEGTDPELLAMVRSKLANEIEEFEEPEEM